MDVPGRGLCAFAAVAVSLGRNVEDAPKVRAELADEVRSNMAWYTENLPKLLLSGRNINTILAILDHPGLTAPHSLWYPMPGGGNIIANAYKRPCISYDLEWGASKTCFPFFVSPPSDSFEPIVLGFTNGNHFVSLQLDFKQPSLIIPFKDTEWEALHLPEADGWREVYKDQMLNFRAEKRKQLVRPPGEKEIIIDVED